MLLAACGNDDVSAEGDDTGSSGSSGPAESSSGDVEPDSSSGEPTTDSGVDSSESSSEDDTTGELPDVEPELAGAGIAAGHAFTCSVADGMLRCWGDNGCGQLGDGTDYGKAGVAIATDREWASVATGDEHTCAIDTDRGLWCWGDGASGKVGDGQLEQFPFSLNCRLDPIPIDPGTTWARVALGSNHSCGVQTDGTLWCWGDNEFGQIGDGSVGALYTRLVPTDVAGEHWIDVFAGVDHSCGLKSDGTVWCWGAGSKLGSLELQFSSTPVVVDLPVPIRALGRSGAADHTCGIAEDGALWCWGDSTSGQIGPGDPMGLPVEVDVGGAVEEVAMHEDTTCARRDDGTMHCFGRGTSGELGDGNVEPGHFSAVPLQIPLLGAAVSIAVGLQHVCARNEDGTEQCWGRNTSGEIGDGTSGYDNPRLQPTIAMPWGGGPIATGWTGVEVGARHGCGVRNGELACWGSRWLGALGNDGETADCSQGNPTTCTVTTPRAVAAVGTWGSPSVGDTYGCAIRDDDTLWCWGSNEYGQLGNAGEAALSPVQVGTDGDWILVDAHDSTTCGIRSPGTLWCWGDNDGGQLGGGDVGGIATDVGQVGTEVDWIDVAVGTSHVCGLRAAGELSCWGRNQSGQLGLGLAGEPIATPSIVPGTWAEVGAGAGHTCAIADDGTLWCWGANAAGAVGPDGGEMVTTPLQVETDADWIAVALATNSTCGLRSDGTAWCWGRNHDGQIGNGEVERDTIVASPTMVADIDDWITISADDATVCGVRSDGTALCWGANGWGQQGNDTLFISGMPREVRDDG